MACPVCGNASACLHERARTAVLIDPDFSEDSEQQFARSLEERPFDERPLERPASLAVAANGGPRPQTAAADVSILTRPCSSILPEMAYMPSPKSISPLPSGHRCRNRHPRSKSV